MPDSEQELFFGQAYASSGENSLPEGVLSAALRNSGATSCSWGNGLGVADQMDPTTDLLQIELLPGTSPDRWNEYASAYPQNGPDERFGDGSGSTCRANELESGCYSDILIGNVWIQIGLQGVNLADGEVSDATITTFMRPIIERLVERVSAASKLAAPLPEEIVPSADCSIVLPLDPVREVLGITEDGVASNSRDMERGGGLSLQQDARNRAGLTNCVVSPLQSDLTWAMTTVLPQGAWAFAPAAASDGIWNGTVPVTIDGASAAYENCSTLKNMCTVDMAVGDSWVSVVIFIEPDQVDDPSKVRALAALVAANIA